jgi:hypothetical protein
MGKYPFYFFFVFFTIQTVQINGWWDTGHMLIAQIAWKYVSNDQPLSTSLRDVIASLETYSDKTSSFVTSACWLDDLKQRGVQQFSEWHYINLPICVDNASFAIQQPLEQFCTVAKPILYWQSIKPLVL